MRDNNIYFDFENSNNDDSVDINSFSQSKQEFEDIVSDSSRRVSASAEINGGRHSAPQKFNPKKKAKNNFFGKMNRWWNGLNKPSKALLITVLVLFVILCLFVIWTILPFQLRGRLFCSAFGLMALNLFIYLGIRWKKRGLQSAIMSGFSVILSAVMVLTLFFWIPFLQRIYNFDDSFINSPEDIAAVPQIDKDITNIALFGIDTRDSKSFTGNSDSIMIMSLNVKTHKVKIFSIMRDTLVPIEQKGKTIYSKINSAYSRGDAKLAVQTLNKIFDLDITDYATVNFFGMAEIIDGVGGIDITLTEAEVKKGTASKQGINEAMNEICAELGLNPKDYYIKTAGTHHANGVQAVAYSRIRYVSNIWGTNNDYGRTDRQRYVMEQLFNKALSLRKSEYPGLISAMIPFTKTSLNPDEILSFALNIMSDSPSFEQARIPQQEFTMKSPSGSFGSVVYYDLNYAKKAIHAMIYEDLTIEEFMERVPVEKNDWYADRKGSSGSSGKTSSSSGSSSNSSSNIENSSKDKDNSSNITSSESSKPKDSSENEDDDKDKDKDNSSGSSSKDDTSSGSSGSSSGSSSEDSSSEEPEDGESGGDSEGDSDDEGSGETEPSEPTGGTSTEVENGSTDNTSP